MEDLFNSFCSFGAGAKGARQMDSAKFAKLCKDCRVLTKKCTATDADLIFTKSKAKGQRKIGYGEFLAALRMVADKKGLSEEALHARMLNAGGPASSATAKVDGDGVLDRLTDTSKYTGAHKHRFDESGQGRGMAGRDLAAKGSGHVGVQYTSGGVQDLSQLLDRSEADVRGVKVAEPEDRSKSAAAEGGSSPKPRATAATPKGAAPGKATQRAAKSATAKARPAAAAQPAGSLGELFKRFCVFGNKGAKPLMDGPKWAKFCKDCKLVSKKFTTTDVDLVFTKCKPKAERKIGYEHFLAALRMAADKKGLTEEALHERLLRAGGPASSTTAKVDGDSVLDRLTDTSKYTGAHKHRFDESGQGRGKDGRVDKDKVVDVSQILDRSSADVRGRTFESTAPGPA